MDKSTIKKMAGQATEIENSLQPAVKGRANVDTQEIIIKGMSKTATVRDHSQLTHLEWEKSGHTGFVGIKYGTTEYWNSQRQYIPPKDLLICYTDYKTFVDEQGRVQYALGFKLGDGNAYLIDKPFLGEELSIEITKHITNGHIHVTEEERAKWNNKLNCVEPQEDSDKLIFTRD